MIGTAAVLLVLIFVISKAWRFFQESSDEIRHIRLLEPWYWFIFLNLALSIVSSNYDNQFVMLGLLLQIALSAWFAVSIGWIIQSCPHKVAMLNESWFVKGKSVKFCYRCGTRLSRDFNATEVRDHSWPVFLFQVPPRLFEYISFWVAQSLMVLISVFLVLRFLKNSQFQNQAVLVAVVLVVLVPPLLYFLGRFRRYLSDTGGMIWWDDFKNSIVTWVLVLAVLWGILHFVM
jgi:hypothetical protein